jgi:hypothetical protein
MHRKGEVGVLNLKTGAERRGALQKAGIQVVPRFGVETREREEEHMSLVSD